MKRWFFLCSVKIDASEDIILRNVNLEFKNAHLQQSSIHL